MVYSKQMKTLNIIVGLVALLLTLGSFYFRSAQITISVALGSAIVIISYYLLALIFSQLASPGKTSKLFTALVAFIKLFIIGCALWFVVTKLKLHIPAFLFGLSTIIIAVCIYAVFAIRRNAT
jgi:hypothetical protein